LPIRRSLDHSDPEWRLRTGLKPGPEHERSRLPAHCVGSHISRLCGWRHLIITWGVLPGGRFTGRRTQSDGDVLIELSGIRLALRAYL